MDPSPKKPIVIVAALAAVLLSCSLNRPCLGDGDLPKPVMRTMPPILRPAGTLKEPSPAEGPGEPGAPAAAEAAGAKAAGDEPPHLYTRQLRVEVPLPEEFAGGPADGGAADEAVVLYVSGNRGRSWVRAQKRALPASAAEFEAANDGQYWCVFRGEPLDTRGPAPEAGTEPQFKVTVDTAAPAIKELVPMPATAGGPLDVLWQIEDRSPLASVTARAVSADGSRTIEPAEVGAEPTGRVRFAAIQPGQWKVELAFRDAAGNVVTKEVDVEVAAPPRVARPPRPVEDLRPVVTPVPAGREARAPGAVAEGGEPEPAVTVRARETIAVLPSRTLSIGYVWDREHPPARVGLWVTRDGGRSWWLDQVAQELTGVFVYRAAEDGVYGFKAHRELGEKVWDAPQNGDAPEREVIVDTTAPKVRWVGPLGDVAADTGVRLPATAAGTVPLRWTVAEENPADQPVALDYRLFKGTQWAPIAGPMADGGAYDWQPAAELRGEIEVRVSVRDRAGHAGAAMLALRIEPAAEPPMAAATDARAVAEASRDARAEARRAYAMATVARLQENWKAAEEQLLRATALDPQYGWAWTDLGGVYLHDGRWEPAVDAYRKATEAMPDSANARLGLARALATRGDLEGATRTLDVLVQQSPDDADAWLLYGDALWKAGNRTRARQCWLKAMGLGGGQQANLAAIQRRLQLKE